MSTLYDIEVQFRGALLANNMDGLTHPFVRAVNLARAQQTRIEKLEAMLKRMEWCADSVFGDAICPCCSAGETEEQQDNDIPGKHYPLCELDALLKEKK